MRDSSGISNLVFKSGNGIPKSSCSISNQPVPTPNLNLFGAISLIVDAIFTRTLGCRNVIGDTKIEYTNFSVSRTKPALAVSKSKAGAGLSLSCLCLPTI